MRRFLVVLVAVLAAGSLVAVTAESASARDYGPKLMVIKDGKANVYWKGHSTLKGIGLSIAVKGNSSAVWPKKSYGITLKKARSLYGLPADTEWRLIANYRDRSLLRNRVAFDLARQMNGLKWTPRTAFVELQLNGKYRGSYLLAESIKIAPMRVNITGKGGQIVEFDKNGKHTFKDDSGMVNALVVPKSTTNRTATKKKVNTFLYNLRTAGKPWPDLIDKPSFVDYYLVREFTKDKDADFLFSNHWYTNSSSASDPIVMGPVWDFDRSAGNEVSTTSIASTKGWWMRGDGVHDPWNSRHWYNRLTKSPTFKKWLCQRWQQKRDVFKHVQDTGVSKARGALGKTAANNDTALWGKSADRPPKRGTGYSGEVDYLSRWYKGRYKWMNDNIC